LNYDLLASYISRFWDDIFSPLILKGTDKHLMVLVKVSFYGAQLDCAYRTLGCLRSVNHSEKEEFTDYLAEKLTHLNESYTSNPIDKINFSYVEKEGLASEDDRRLFQKNITEENITYHRFNNLTLPITMEVSGYGTIRATTQFETFTRYIVNSGARNYEIDVSLDKITNEVTILGATNLKWTDTKQSEGFKRVIGKSTKYFIDGVNVLNKQLLPAKPFRRTKMDRKKDPHFITMDIETVKINNKLTPYLICGYNGSEYITSYASSILDQEALFQNFMDQLLEKEFLKSKSKNINVYAHNLSGFDGIFLMRHLSPYGIVDPVRFKERLIAIKLKTFSGKTFLFKDSFLM
jgi:hypothetical protein